MGIGMLSGKAHLHHVCAQTQMAPLYVAAIVGFHWMPMNQTAQTDMCALAGDTLCSYQKTSCLFTLLEPCVQVCSRVDPASHCCHNQIQWLIVGHRETKVVF